MSQTLHGRALRETVKYFPAGKEGAGFFWVPLAVTSADGRSVRRWLRRRVGEFTGRLKAEGSCENLSGTSYPLFSSSPRGFLTPGRVFSSAVCFVSRADTRRGEGDRGHSRVSVSLLLSKADPNMQPFHVAAASVGIVCILHLQISAGGISAFIEEKENGV